MNKRAAITSSLLDSVEHIRNVCILAHVDHGKTTLADALLATNGIVSSKQAGKLRYMDNTEAEQERGITMKSSVVGLIYNASKQTIDNDSQEETYLVNLVDSPGHVDFASEVSTAVRLCDAAVILIDIVEGVCPQTRSVLRQAWNERLAMILVLNKIDRLKLELKLTAGQAFETICRVIEQANSILAEMFTSDALKQQNDSWELTKRSIESGSQSTNPVTEWTTNHLDQTDSLYFSLERGNVLLSSAIDSWGFRPADLVPTWINRLTGCKADELARALGSPDCYLGHDPQTKTVLFKSGAQIKYKKPAFVQLALEPLWNVYETIVVERNHDKLQSMSASLGVPVDSRLLNRMAFNNNQTDSRALARSLLSAWLPLGRLLFNALVGNCPSPNRGAVLSDRANHMLYGTSMISTVGLDLIESSQVTTDRGDHLVADNSQTSSDHIGSSQQHQLDSTVSQALQACSSSPDAPTIVFVAKVFWTEKSQFTNKSQPLPGPIGSSFKRQPPDTDPPMMNVAPTPTSSSEDPFEWVDFVALSRVFSGRVSVGQRLFVLGPKFDGNKIPDYLLDADPNDFPVGPLRLRGNKSDPPSSPLDKTPRNRNRTLSSGTNSSDCESITPTSSTHSGGRRSRPFLKHVYVVVVSSIFQCLGSQRDLVPLVGDASVPAGNIIGLTGPNLIAYLPKSGLLVDRLSLVSGSPAATANNSSDRWLTTQSSSSGVLPLAGLSWHGEPVISVAVEPVNLDHIYRLERGLQLLDRADPCAQVSIKSTGEYIIRASGEVHLQKCLEDLSKHFAPGVDLHTSPFVVPFRETLTSSSRISPPLSSFANLSYKRAVGRLESLLTRLPNHVKHTNPPPPVDSDGIVNDSLRNYSIGSFQLPHCKQRTRVLLRVSAHPMPQRMIDWVAGSGSRLIPQLIRAYKRQSPCYQRLLHQLKTEFAKLCNQLANDHQSTTNESSSWDWNTLSGRLLALGPHQSGTNALFCAPPTTNQSSFPLFTAWGDPVVDCKPDTTTNNDHSSGPSLLPLISYAKALLRGFQLVTQAGPLCGDPMHGVAFVLEQVEAQTEEQLELPELEEFDTAAYSQTSPSLPDDVVEIDPESLETQRTRLSSVSWSIQQPTEFKCETKSLSTLSSSSNSDSEASLNDDADEWELESGGDDYLDDDRLAALSSSDNETNGVSIKPVAEGHVIDWNEEARHLRYWRHRSDQEWLHDVPPGYLTSAMSRACSAAFCLSSGQRLMLAMYKVELQARTDVLGRMFAVLRKRHGRVINEDLIDGEAVFVISARLPVIESFGFAEELRSRTSGIVSLPQLRPGGWELLDIDPSMGEQTTNPQQSAARRRKRSPTKSFKNKSSSQSTRSSDHQRQSKWSMGDDSEKPVLTKARDVNSDDDEDQMDEALAPLNRVRRYIRDVRIRKGLPTMEQLVQCGDKQRTLKKNK